MKRFDYLTPVGFVLGTIIIVIGIISGSGVSGFRSFLDLTSFFIVTGGLCAAVFISFPPSELKKAPSVLKQAFIRQEDNVKDSSSVNKASAPLLKTKSRSPFCFNETKAKIGRAHV